MRNLALLLTLLIFFKSLAKAENSNLVEDITDQNDSEEEEEEEVEDDTPLQTFPTPPPIGTTTSTGRNRGGTQKFQIFNEKDIALGQNNGYNRQPGPENRSEKARDVMGNSQDQIIAGIPDLNDPCFRRYENSIIVNAQPYERRSSTGLIHCKSHCLSSQSGVYSCKSFVYDNVNMICDLFAHVGDQAPARLLKFQTRDYFEPTYAVHCLEFGSPPSPPPSSPLEHPVALATNTKIETSSPVPLIQKEQEQEQEQEQESFDSSSPDLVTSEDVSSKIKVAGSQQECASGKLPAFLKTEGFELYKNDEEQMSVGHVSECAESCKSNHINGRPLTCKSFDYLISSSTCSFTNEAAVPVGNGQLKQREDAAYHEKICVSQTFVNSCPNSFFSRHPQMILVGFAESVIDSTSFESCFDSCLNSYQLFGFNCTSGMYYFEESQLNCILNSENRNTQKELFTEENTDIVDYFEVECREKNKRKMAGVRNFETSAIQADNMLLGEKLISSNSQEDENGSRWETWSECIDGKQTRRKSCTNFNTIDDCAEEVRDCPTASTTGGLRMSIKRAGPLAKTADDPPPSKAEIAEVKRKIKTEGFRCPLNTCCRVFSGCSYGLRHNSHTKQLEWCKRPCKSDETVKRARLV